MELNLICLSIFSVKITLNSRLLSNKMPKSTFSIYLKKLKEQKKLNNQYSLEKFLTLKLRQNYSANSAKE